MVEPTIRSATKADATAILDFHITLDIAELGEPNSTIEQIDAGLTTPGSFDGVIDDPAGGVVGHAWLYYQGGEKCWGDAAILPATDPAFGPPLLDWLRTTADREAPGKPIHVFARSTNPQQIELYAGTGAPEIRRSYRMGIALDSVSTGQPDLPAGVEIRQVNNTDAERRMVHAIVDTSFADHFAHDPETYDVWWERVAAESPDFSLWWLATVDGVPAAAALCSQTSVTLGLVDTLGTLRDYRGRGLGGVLMQTAFAEFSGRGTRRVNLAVDATNPTGAVGLYQSLGMAIENESLRYELPPLTTG
jgi:ribosomal protein S18 acetylase RimI-like enzyme